MLDMFRAGIVGIGKLGSIHLRIYKGLKGIGKIYLADTNTKTLNLHKEYCHFKDYRDLKGKIDLVSIATPTSSHYEIASFFLKNKIPVLVEKPLTQDLKEAKKLTKSGIISATNFEKAVVRGISNTNKIIINSAQKVTRKVLK